jgi:hypothetical protein
VARRQTDEAATVSTVFVQKPLKTTMSILGLNFVTSLKRRAIEKMNLLQQHNSGLDPAFDGLTTRSAPR